MDVDNLQRRSDAYVILGENLRKMRKFDGAKQCFQKALLLRPDNISAIKKFAGLLERINQVIPANELVKTGMLLNSEDHELNFIAAKLERRGGDFQKAIDRLNTIIQKTPDRKFIRKYHFELGRLYELTRNEELAFFHFNEGNKHAAQIADELNIGKQSSVDEIKKTTEMLTDPRMTSGFPTASVTPSKSPVFLIGFPRSGTTLLDQILDSHPALQTVEERPAVYSMVRIVETMQNRYPFALFDLTPKDILRLRETYYQAVDKYITRKSGCILIDKLPLNIVKVPLILTVFPDAKFVLAVRHPYDVCLSCFMHNFKLNQHMVNFLTLEDSALYYSQVIKLWQSYTNVFHFQSHRIKLEDIITDFKPVVARLLDFIGVGWDNSVFDYRSNALKRKYIKTPSYHQVMEPVNSKGVNRFQRYPQIQSVRNNLKPFAEYFDYSNI